MPSRRSISKLPNGKFRARYTTPDGPEHAKHFAKKGDAEAFLDSVVGDIASGRYRDPRAGKKLFSVYAEEWLKHQRHRDSTTAQLRSRLDRHILPQLGGYELGAIRKTHLQGWLKGREAELAPATVKNLANWVGTILRSAVEDGLIVSSPMNGVSIPKRSARQVVPFTLAQVEAIAAEMPDEYRAAVIVAAATGLRQGELFGLTVDRVDFLGRAIRVDRQLVNASEPPVFGPPKTDASHRAVPLPDVALTALSEQIRTRPGRHGLVFTDGRGRAVSRQQWSAAWRKAAAAAGIPEGVGGTRPGSHALRHFYASVLIRSGSSVKAVQARLGHASAAETLNTYAHLWPDEEEVTRAAIDAAFHKDSEASDSASG